MDIPDYSRYTLAQLQDVLSRIEKDKYPEKVKAIEEQIKFKQNEVTIDDNYKLLGKSLITYKNKWFILVLISILSILGLINFANILIEPKILPIVAFISILISFILILSNHPKLIIAIKSLSILFIVIGSFGVISIVLELFLFILKTADEYKFNLSLLDSFTSLVLFTTGIFYFFNMGKYVVINTKVA